MRVRRLLIGAAMAAAVCTIGAPTAGAASITYTPATITYGAHSTTRVTGLTPRASYTIQIYNPSNVPLIPGGFPITADASGNFTTNQLDPDQTDLPGTYLFEVQTPDNKVVARTSPTLVGTNTYYRIHRLFG